MKKIVCAIIFLIAVNKDMSGQCTPTFSYTSTSSSISLTSTTAGTTLNTRYNWALSGGIYNTINDSVYTFSGLYNGTYTVTLTLDSSACDGTSSQVVIVSGGANAPACNASFTYTVAAAGQVDFTNTSPVDPYSNTTYMWTFGSPGMTSNSENPTYNYYYNGTYNVMFRVNNAVSGCYTLDTQVVVISNANTAPPCNSNFTYTVGAAGLVNFTSSYTSIPPYGGYWDYGNGAYGNDSSTSYTYPYNGTYNVKLTIQDSLANCFSITTQTLTITNAATQPCTPTVTFSMHQDSMNPQPGVWQISSYYSPQVSSAVWFWGDGTSTTGFSPTHTYASAGQYSICVTVYSMCGDSSTNCQYDSLYRMAHNNAQNSMISVTVQDVNNVGATAGIKSSDKGAGQVSIYPNPSTGVFALQINNVSSSVAQIVITNILGGVVYSSQEHVTSNSIVKEMDLLHLSNGAYFMKVRSGDRTYTNKIIISK